MNDTTYALYDANEKQAHVVVYFSVSPAREAVTLVDAVDGIELNLENPDVVSKEEARRVWRDLVSKGWKRCA